MRASGGLLVLPLLLLGCGGERSGEGPIDQSPALPSPPTVADSLVLTTRTGTELWFIEGREARDSSGATCHERGIEIRDSLGRRRVPLLYTLEAPAILDDTSVRALTYLHCQPRDAYRVSLRTGRPTPIAP